ncbi:thiol reductant ABC exporter subunit CydC [Prosthecochloris sp. N3]|uniref:Thiol reductant ABC exporter subunit CydC n=1 Tax=Prosthecochloris ethylica TaxID=2743976 RepID=A0ABR9XTK8_9CHLB|nr:thiol reductant ABC exporter subunit CydC [Prosthecochloris ethylica]MBF0587195.1 thiol reductant ABC exporter subunit CydC [Prosthecochloris ethylica]MBF0637273.1 thiol reductant ABC exporter subunit CydC [Prosthecochloris ethylica]NUK48464.1 thiol reductant ABC exporter subunit CydC [Prosthecochloris ethylica]
MNILVKLLKLARPYTWWLLLALITGWATITSSIGLLMTAAWLIAKAALQPSFHELQIGIVGVRFFGIARGVLRYLERLVSHSTTFRLLARIRVWFYTSLEPLAPARLSNYKSGDLLQRIVGDIDTLENLYSRVIAPPLTALLVTILMWWVLGIFAWPLSLALFCFHALAALGIPLLSAHLTRGMATKLSTVRTAQQATTIDFVQGMAELQLFNRLDSQLADMNTLKQQELDLIRRQNLVRNAHEPLVSLCMSAAVITTLLILGPLVGSGTLDSIWSGVIVIGVMASFEAFLPLPAALEHLDADREAGKRIFDIIDAEPEVATPENPLKPGADHTIGFHNVSFSYPGSRRKALDQVSFTLEHGRKTAIVGPSGAGKSTIAALLHRFYNPTEGTITLGGIDIMNLDPDDVRNHVGTVSQRTYLFARTIRENLLIGNPQADDEELKRALEEAGLETFSDKLDQWAGQHGMQLSGGERQRLSLARALLHDAPVLILDEATANLDTITEKAIMENMMAFGNRKTLVAITHRLYGMEAFDRILVLKNGHIAEQGSHSELMARGGLYAAMWNLQHRNQLDSGS